MTTPAYCTCRPGATVWLTGPPGADRDRLARAAARSLRRAHRRVEILSDAALDRVVGTDPTPSGADRRGQALRIGRVAHVLARNGTTVLVTVPAPDAATRARVRAWHLESGTRYLEVRVGADADSTGPSTAADPAHGSEAAATLRALLIEEGSA
ncbi:MULTISPECIES: adenylyl-sulfate kinase [unclassified Embleya]|uniref:adenylyl-sulfate kinase n=1 Tax=unclassified Embleya TaxID=2699296 RepID=UPI0033C189BC